MFSYKNNGNSLYYPDPNGISQSPFVIILVNLISQVPFGLTIYFSAVDLACVYF